MSDPRDRTLPATFQTWPREERVAFFEVSRRRGELVEEIAVLTGAPTPENPRSAYLRKEFLAHVASALYHQQQP